MTDAEPTYRRHVIMSMDYSALITLEIFKREAKIIWLATVQPVQIQCAAVLTVCRKPWKSSSLFSEFPMYSRMFLERYTKMQLSASRWKSRVWHRQIKFSVITGSSCFSIISIWCRRWHIQGTKLLGSGMMFILSPSRSNIPILTCIGYGLSQIYGW